MQRDHANLLPACLGQCLIDQLAGKFLAAMLGFNVNIQQVAALVLAWVEGVRRPVEDDQTGAGNHLAVFGGEPAKVPSIRQPGFHPWLKVLRHHIQNPVVLATGVDKHAPPVMGDDGRVCGRRCSYLGHARSIEPFACSNIVAAMQATPPTLRSSLFRPGQRIAVAVSGGADSVALLRRLLEERLRLGIVLSVVHVHHGIRGAAADDDAAFVGRLAATYDLVYDLHRTDAAAAAATLHETLEEACRNLRYAFFQKLMADGRADAVATAHTLDDQAETVLHKLLRGAWTEGLSGIHPVLAVESGTVLRPFLQNSHGAIEAWLLWLHQPWCEDASNQDMAHTRNRIRRQLLPLLRTFNPQIAAQLARLAAVSAGEEAYWQAELARLLPSLVLPGRPSRGGGRASSTHPEEETVAIEQARLRELHPAVARRVLRAAARRLGARLSFEHTEQLLAMAGPASAENSREPARSAKFDLPGGIKVERSLREIRLTRRSSLLLPGPAYEFSIPGEICAPEYGVCLRAGLAGAATVRAVLRPWRAGDRVTLRHSRGAKKVAEVLDRLHIVGEARKNWPVIESEGTIVWMRGAEIEAPGFTFSVQLLP
jgi:tRNA(Ile)-lysidine synthase